MSPYLSDDRDRHAGSLLKMSSGEADAVADQIHRIPADTSAVRLFIRTFLR